MAARGNTAGGWAEAQRIFRESYADDDGAVPRTAVFYRVQRRSNLLRRLFSDQPQMVSLALWHPEANEGEAAALEFAVDPSATERIASEGNATVAGDATANGALCVEARGGVVWPIYNPHVPWGRRAPRR